ncbi:hypothetical protein B0H13DRAFT_1852045 [Mycena leptocephala]|nr:hypothetical protein B0H13DRAFT_1852045 [Mycena leptocephala]
MAPPIPNPPEQREYGLAGRKRQEASKSMGAGAVGRAGVVRFKGDGCSVGGWTGIGWEEEGRMSGNAWEKGQNMTAYLIFNWIWIAGTGAGFIVELSLTRESNLQKGVEDKDFVEMKIKCAFPSISRKTRLSIAQAPLDSWPRGWERGKTVG